MMKLDQLCFHCAEPWQADMVKHLFGLADAPWIEDDVVMQTRLAPNTEWFKSSAKLMFNEELGIQLEIMRVQRGPSWINLLGSQHIIFISHIGLHLAADEPWPAHLENKLVQESITHSHSAPAFHDESSPQYGRRYHYRIYRMPHTNGVYLKLIRRLHNGHDGQDP